MPKIGATHGRDARPCVSTILLIHIFFGPSISNVTVIVGENGSGKSNLMEFIVRLFEQGTGFWNEPFIVVNRMDDKLRIWYFKKLQLNAPDEVHGIQLQKSFFTCLKEKMVL